MVGEPGQRMMGVAEHVGAAALPDLDAVDDGHGRPQSSRSGAFASRGNGAAEHAAGGEEIVCHQRRRAQGLPFEVTVVDDLDRRQIGLDRRLRPHSAVNGAFAGRQIAREPDGDFTFDADADDSLPARNDAPLSKTPLANTPPAQGCGMSRYCFVAAPEQPIL